MWTKQQPPFCLLLYHPDLKLVDIVYMIHELLKQSLKNTGRKQFGSLWSTSQDIKG